MYHELKASDLSPIIEYLNDCHEGDLLSLSEWLNEAVYMLHYLPADTFSELERQNASHILMGLKEALIKIHHTLNERDG